jgi:hypothetical protein
MTSPQPHGSPARPDLLAGCRDLMLHRASLQLAAALDRLAEILLDHASKSFETKVVNNLMDARAVLQRERLQISESFGQALLDRINGKREPGIPGPKDAPSSELSLQSEEVLDEFVAARSLSRSIESACLADVPAFHQRVATLLDHPTLKLSENAFAPPSIVGALVDGMLSVQTNPEVRMAWIRGLTLMGGLGFRDVYADLNRFLIDGGVQVPALRVSHSTGSSASAGSSAGAFAGGEMDANSAHSLSDDLGAASAQIAQLAAHLSGGGVGAAAMHDGGMRQGAPMQMLASNLVSLVERLQHLVPAISGGPSMSDPSIAAMVRNKEALQVSAALGFAQNGSFKVPVQGVDRKLMASLTEMQVVNPSSGGAIPTASVLRQVVPGYTSGDISVLDATTTELVAMLFDFVFARRELRDEIKVLLGRLQIPMLKGAMVDRGFFSRKNHPARQLLNRLADLGIGWSPEDGSEDAVYKKIAHVVDVINRDFTDDLGVFTAGLVEVEQFISEVEQDAQPAIEAETAEAADADRHLVAMQTARQAVDKRVGQHALPEQVREFIEVAWQPHLQDALLEKGQDSPEYEQAVEALDELIWSVAPKDQPAERAQLSKRVPALVRRLRSSLKSLSDDTVNPFFDRLFEVHSGLMRGTTPDYVEPDVVEEPDEDEGFDPFQELVKQMERNQWIEMSDEKGALTYAKLAWMSPQGTTYLFTTRHGRKAASLSPMELAEWFRTDRARLIESEPIVDRALAGMFNAAA